MPRSVRQRKKLLQNIGFLQDTDWPSTRRIRIVQYCR